MSSVQAKKPDSPLTALDPRQQERLKELSGSIRLEKVTVSYSLMEQKEGRKQTAHHSVTASRAGEETPYTLEEVRIVRQLLGKMVVSSVYDTAIKSGMLTIEQAQAELAPILTRYDHSIAKLVMQEGK